MCLLRGTNWIFIYNSGYSYTLCGPNVDLLNVKHGGKVTLKPFKTQLILLF